MITDCSNRATTCPTGVLLWHWLNPRLGVTWALVELGRSLADNLSVPQDPNLPAASSQPLTLEDHKMLRIALLSESHSRFVVSVRPDNREVFEALTGEAATMLGGVTRRKQVVMTWCGRPVVDVGSGRLYEAWSTGLRD